MIDTPTEASAQPNAGPERDARERLIVALNSPTVDDAQELIGELEGLASVFKIGLQLQIDPRVGELIANVLDELAAGGGETVASAARAEASEICRRFPIYP